MPGNRGGNGSGRGNSSKGGSDGPGSGSGGGDRPGVDPNRSPTGISLSGRSVKENRKRVRVGELTTLDPDAGDTYRYVLLTGTDAFRIDGNVLIATRSFDHERRNSYTIRVQAIGINRPTDTYEQQFTISIDDVRDGTDPNRKRQSAISLGTLTAAGLSRKDSIGGVEGGADDRNDYFRFDLRAAGSLTARLSNLKADADLQIFNGAGQRIGRSRTDGRRPDILNFPSLAAGTYYVRVLPDGDERTRYRLRLGTVPVPAPAPIPTPRPVPAPIESPQPSPSPGPSPGPSPQPSPSPSPTDPNGSFSTAVDLGILPVYDANSVTVLPLQREGNIGATDTSYGTDQADYFRFNLNVPSGNFAVSISGLSGDADLDLYDSNRNLVISAELSGNRTDAVFYSSVPVGTYYARVRPYANAVTDYTLSVIAGTAEGNGFGTSQALGNGILDANDTLLSVNGTIDSGTENEFYWFRPESFTGNDISIQLTNLSADADIRVFNGAFEFLGQSINGGSFSELLTLTTANGLRANDTYYVQVRPFAGATTSYTLNVYD